MSRPLLLLGLCVLAVTFPIKGVATPSLKASQLDAPRAYWASMRRNSEARLVLSGSTSEDRFSAERGPDGTYVYTVTNGPLSTAWGFDGRTSWHRLYNGYVGIASTYHAEILSAAQAFLSGSLFSQTPKLLYYLRPGNAAVYRYMKGPVPIEVVFDLEKRVPKIARVVSPNGMEAIDHIIVTKTQLGNMITSWCFEQNCFHFDRASIAAGHTRVGEAVDQMENPPRLEIPFTEENGLLMVDGYHDKKRLRFAFDTGTDVLEISPAAGAALGFARLSKKEIFLSNGSKEASLGFVEGLTLGTQTFARQVAALVQTAGPYDGLINGTFFGGSVVDIDYHRRVISVNRSVPCDGTPIDLYDGHPEITGAWEGHRSQFQLDTGAPFTALIPKGSLTYRGAEKGTVAQLQFASVALGPLDVYFQDTTQILGRPNLGIIGNDVLRKYHVHLDYKHGLLQLRKPEDAVQDCD